MGIERKAGGATRRLMPLCALLLLGLAPAPAHAVETRIDDALNAATVGGPAATRTLRNYLERGSADVEEIARRARELIAALRLRDADPLALRAAAERVADTATRSLDTVPILRAERGGSLTPPAGAVAIDLGPPDSAAEQGFQAAGSQAAVVEGGDMRAISRPGSDPLQSDGVLGVRRIRLSVPNGLQRIVLLSDDLGDPTAVARPLGTAITVNGVQRQVRSTDADGWPAAGRLGSGPSRGAAGMLVLQVEVTDGRLAIDFEADAASDLYLTGLIVEDAAGPSSVTIEPGVADPRADPERLLAARADVDAAVAELIADIATAAGPEQRAALLQLQQPAVRPELTVSPN